MGKGKESFNSMELLFALKDIEIVGGYFCSMPYFKLDKQHMNNIWTIGWI